MANKRAIILYDGSNFYHKLKTLGLTSIIDFDYSSFNKYLTKGNQLLRSDYLVGEIRPGKDKKSIDLKRNQQKLFVHLQKHHVHIHRGFILKIGNTYYEKGVDVQIAVELMRGAYKDEHDIAYLISSDTDLLPAIHEAQSVGKTVCYVGFRHNMSYALKNQCKQYRLLTKDDLEPFVA